MSTPTAAVIMIVVIAVVGAGGYFAFNSSTTSPGTNISKVIHCSPSTSPVCTGIVGTHDVSLLIPFAAARTGNLVPVTASVPSSDGTVSSYSFNFGDGSAPTTGAASTVNHAYTEPGSYIISVTATIGGAAHDNYHNLGVVSVVSASTSLTAQDVPGVAGSVTANSTSGTAPTAILSAGQFITVSGAYTGQPTNPDFVAQSPTIGASSGGTISGASNTSSSATATVTFASSGVYWVKFEGSAKSLSTSSVVDQNFTFTVFVSPSGVNAGAASTGSSGGSKHAGHLIVYELVPGGSTSEDPAVDYETAGYEPILNVYQTLIAYNGSTTGPSPGAFVPVLAACVPGSTTGANNCNTLFGNSLASGSDYTFVIDGHAKFYDPATKASWGVWPTDVLFSLARTMGFSVLPCFGCNNGWIVTQALLSSGNGLWDGGIHGARNNTPQNVYNAITLNGSACTSAMMAAPYHGCVTFHANGNGLNWPYFLELIADGLGSSIVPCGVFSSSQSSTSGNAGIPYWTKGNVTDAGDHPCAAPGTTGWGLAPTDTNLPATGWDAWEKAGSSPPFVGNVQWNMVGSGPYYMNQLNIGQSFSLQANPGYSPNPLCTWTGCFPAVGKYAPSVSVTWETSQLPGEVAYQNGVADFASIPSPDTGLLLQLVAQGKIKTLGFPGISIDFMPFNLAFNVAGAQRYTTNPITVPSDFMSYVGLREFIVHAYPYGTIQSTINTKDGIQYAFNYGGAIPQFMANYYPTNVSWPTGDPAQSASVTGGAAWWWSKITDSSNTSYYDPELAGCSSSNPCQFPLFGETGAPDLDQRIGLWAAEINSLSGGALRANPLDINFIDLVLNSLYSGPYQNAMPLYRLGWAPDYPDPTDYMVPLYYPDSSYTASDTVLEQSNQAAFNSSSCHPWQDIGWWSTYAQTYGGVPTNCQGAAYAAMILGMHEAAVMPAGPARVLMYNMVEQIANGLALYAYTFQTSLVASYATYIDGTTLNTNVTIGGGNDQTWYTIGGTGVTG
ncbi:MAG TPA: PKD domain-containing protein [Thermoplasmata archaeon]|nr:PKD domain-containing protein [Thermoplasmata archaeon]